MVKINDLVTVQIIYPTGLLLFLSKIHEVKARIPIFGKIT